MTEWSHRQVYRCHDFWFSRAVHSTELGDCAMNTHLANNCELTILLLLQPEGSVMMSIRSGRPEDDGEILKRLVAWFHHSSLRFTEEYRRLEDRVAHLDSALANTQRELATGLRERDETRGYLQSVLESLKAGILVLDQHLGTIFVNHHLRELVGSIDEARVMQLLGARLGEHLKRRTRAILPLECERVVQGANGCNVPVHITMSEFIDSDNHSAGYVLVFQDISRLKRLEAETARSRRLASLGEMAAGITHEIRNPLGGIELYASLIKDQHEGEAKRLAGEILHAVHRLQSTISRLLSFAAEPRLTVELLPVTVLLHEVTDMVFPLLHHGKWRLALEVEEALPPLYGDRALLTQALTNLVINAVEAMPLGGSVTIQAQQARLFSPIDRYHRAIEIRVEDEGPGIPPADRERVFDPFFTTKLTGTGLGLALTHKIIGAHRGSIEVSSAPVRGSCFTVLLPVADGADPVYPHPGAAVESTQDRQREKDYEETNCYS